MEGYLFDRDDAKKAFRQAAGVAHDAGRMVSLTLSDSFCVDRHRDDFRPLVRDEVDMLFGNEAELLLAVPARDLRRGRRRVRGGLPARRDHRRREGFDHRHRRTTSSRCPAEPVARVLDTTGAGDLYAAGFLLRAHHRLDRSPECGRLGSIAASEVISHVGPRPLVELRTLVR